MFDQHWMKIVKFEEDIFKYLSFLKKTMFTEQLLLARYFQHK